MLAGEAARKKADWGPAQRQAANSVNFTISADGPAETLALTERIFSCHASGSTAVANTHPRTVRPCSGTRTSDPTCA